MFDLPSLSVDDTQLFADWVELNVLCLDRGEYSQSDIGDIFKDAGIICNEEGDLPKGDYGYTDDLIFSSDDEAGRLTEEIWRLLKLRQMRGGYPFEVDAYTIQRQGTKWQSSPAYTTLLLTDICRKYTLSTPVSLEAGSSSGRLFEKIVQAAAPKLFRGPSVRFGWPRDSDWPTGINDRINHLGAELNLVTESLEGKTNSRDKDRGLDVIAKLEFGDHQFGTPYFLIQCALGNNWREKRGEPTHTDWDDIFQWNGPRLRAVAVPWRLEKPHDYRWTYRHFDATILDRPRLVTGVPDESLDRSIVKEMCDWCNSQLEKVPLL